MWCLMLMWWTAHRLRRHRATALTILAVAALYYARARLGLLQQLVRGQVTPLWPPPASPSPPCSCSGRGSGRHRRRRPRWSTSPSGPTVPSVLAIVIGNTVAPLCAYLLLTRAGFRHDLDRLRDGLALVFLGGLGPC